MTKLSDTVWTKKEIKKAVNIISKAKHKKSDFIKSLDKAVYWFILIIAVLGNLFVAVALVPVLITFTSLYTYLVIAIVALAFGLLFEIIIRDIEHLEETHHLAIGLIIPLFAVLNFFVIVWIINNMNIIPKFNPVTMGLTYAFMFIIPYAYAQLFLK